MTVKLPEPYELVETVHGLMIANVKDVYIGRALKTYGESCYLEWKFLNQIIQPGDHVVDIGANVGVHTLGFARSVGPKGLVWAFEIQNPLFQNLCANMALNMIQNVWAYQIGLGDENGHVFLADVNINNENNYGGISLERLKSNNAHHPTLIRRLDSICTSTALRLIKIDVEGMELQVLKGAERIIAQQKPILYVENDNTDKAEALVDYIFSLGYNVWLHWPPLFNPKNYNNIKENKIGPYVSKNILCVHKDSGVHVEELVPIKTLADLKPYYDL